MSKSVYCIVSELLKLFVLYFSMCYESECALFLVLCLMLIYAVIKSLKWFCLWQSSYGLNYIVLIKSLCKSKL
jgi:hypothetical protein